jgi:hypothetical protein
MSDHERHLLAREFGIRVRDTECVAEPFWGSPAFRSLAERVRPAVETCGWDSCPGDI